MKGEVYIMAKTKTATKPTRARRPARAKVEPELVQEAQPEPVVVEPEPVPEPEGNDLIRRVYLVTKAGNVVLEGEDALADMRGIYDASRALEDGDRAYTFYEDGAPVYIAIKNGNYSPVVFPEPGPDIGKGETGMTSMELYGLAVTLASTVEKIIERETEPKPSLIDQARKVMTPTLVIVGAIIAIFLIVVMIGG